MSTLIAHQSEMVDRLLNLYDRADDSMRRDGMRWYDLARAYAIAIADGYGYRTDQTAVALAHLSPRVHWSRNKAMLYDLVQHGDTVGLRGCIERAKIALASTDPLSTLKGPKTTAFAYNILGDYSHVTVDVHAAHAALGYIPSNLGKRLYQTIADAYRAAALEVNIPPAQYQACVWIVQRGKAQ